MTEDNISRGIDGDYWIFTRREKNEQPVKIPLLDEAWNILRKYGSYSEKNNGQLLKPSFLGKASKVCIMALGSDSIPNRVVQQPRHNVKEMLGYVLDMVPYDEMEFVDKVRELLSKAKPYNEPKNTLI